MPVPGFEQLDVYGEVMSIYSKIAGELHNYNLLNPYKHAEHIFLGIEESISLNEEIIRRRCNIPCGMVLKIYGLTVHFVSDENFLYIS